MDEISEEYQIELYGRCRKGFTIKIPCNWNIDGFCGIDTKPCHIENIFIKK